MLTINLRLAVSVLVSVAHSLLTPRLNYFYVYSVGLPLKTVRKRQVLLMGDLPFLSIENKYFIGSTGFQEWLKSFYLYNYSPQDLVSLILHYRSYKGINTCHAK